MRVCVYKCGVLIYACICACVFICLLVCSCVWACVFVGHVCFCVQCEYVLCVCVCVAGLARGHPAHLCIWTQPSSAYGAFQEAMALLLDTG